MFASRPEVAHSGDREDRSTPKPSIEWQRKISYAGLYMGAGRSVSLALTSNQLSMWLGEQVMPGLTLTVGRIDIAGPLDAERFEEIWNAVIEADPATRLVLELQDSEPAFLVEAQPVLEHAEADDPEAFVKDWIQRKSLDMHDPGQPLIAGCLIKVNAEQHVMLLGTSHIICDGASTSQLIGRIFGGYAGQPVEPIDSAQLAAEIVTDYLASDQYEQDREFWAGYAEQLEQVCPADPERVGLRDRVHHVRTELDEELKAGLQRYQEAGISPVKVMAAAATFLEARMNDSDTAVVGLVAGGRPRNLPVQPLAFLSTILPTLQSFSPTDSIADFIASSWTGFSEVLEHQQIQPLPETQTLNAQLANAYSSTINILRVGGAFPIGTDTHIKISIARMGPAHEINYILDIGNPAEPIFIVELDADKFSEAEAESLKHRYVQVLRQFCDESIQTLAHVELMTPVEREALAQGNVSTPESARTLIDAFAAGASRNPEHIALTFGHTSLIYSDLDEGTTKMAQLLRAEYGIGPDSIVGILMDRSQLPVIAMLAALKAGAAYLPIDPGLPQHRITEMITDAQPTVVLCQSIYEDLVPKLDGHPAVPAVHINPLLAKASSSQILDVELPQVLPDNAAYVIYTSGTTGRPKGVVVTHRAALSWIDDWAPQYEITSDDVVSCTHSFQFDVSFWECWAALSYGAHLVVLDSRIVADPPTLINELHRSQVTIFGATPSALVNLIEYWDSAKLAVRTVTVAGEALDESATDGWREQSGITLYNMYGPTETNVVTGVKVPGAITGSIGGALDQVKAYVLNSTLELVPPGVPGELYVSGAHLARGYHGQPGFTAGRFVANPFGEGDRLYRTGDIVRWVPTADGFELSYEGRGDSQVKLRGYRVELAEVARAAASHTEVKHAVAVVREDRTGVKQLVVYLTAESPELQVEPRVIKSWIAKRLPSYMVPAAVVQLDSFPLTRNGKLDERSLPAPEYAGSADEAERMSALEREIADSFGSLLGVTNVGPDDSFIDLGGDSLQAIALVREIAAHTGIELRPASIFANLTPSLLAAEINNLPEYRDRSLANAFRQYAREHAHRPALSATDSIELFTYEQLDELTDRFAARLQQQGVRPGDTVALLMQRSHRCVIAILGCLKAGAAYVFIEPSNPAQRSRDMLADVGDSMLVVDLKINQHLLTDLEIADYPRLLEYGEHSQWPKAQEFTPASFRSLTPAYLIYTSGTTGKPKAVVVSNDNVLTWLDGKRELYGTHNTDVIATTASFAFDISVTEMWVAFAGGAKLVVFDSEVQRSPRALVDSYHQNAVTVIMQTPAMFRAILDLAGRNGDPLQELELSWVSVGGEQINESNQRRFDRWWNRRIVRPRFYNLYGPTETTMTVCGAVIPTQVPGSIGMATGHVIFRVLDDQLQELGPGEVGELYVSGPQVALGYLHRPALTAARFVADPFAADGSVMYRTGDLVNWGGPLGNEIVFHGRNDDQVKLRGFRIELGDILAAISEVSGCQALVRLHTPRHGGKTVVAYLVGDSIDVPELRAKLDTRLPRHMIPASFVVLPEFPLTANGKLDVNALPEPTIRGTGGRMSPQEAAIARTIGELLEIEDVGPDDSFFDLGGDSLLVTRLVSELDRAGFLISVSDVFSAPTPRGIAQHAESIEEQDRRATVQLKRLDLPDRTALTPSQARMRFLNRLDIEGGMYNLAVVLELRGSLDPQRFAEAIKTVVRKQQTLRTLYPTGPSGMPYQDVVRMSKIDWSQVLFIDPAIVPLADALETARSDSRRGFDLLRELPLRVRLAAIAEDKWILSIVMHHVASDGESVAPLMADISAAYNLAPGSRLEPLPIRYRDYTIWEQLYLGDTGDTDSVASRQREFWIERLRGLPQELSLPYDRPRPAEPQQTGSAVRFTIPDEIRAELEDIASYNKTSFFVGLLALLGSYLFKLTGDHDIVVGTPVAGRNQPGLAGIVGLFLNSVVVRTQHHGTQTFDDAIDDVAQWMAAALDNTDVPFEFLVEALQPQRTPGRNPLFQTVMVFDRYRQQYSDLQLGEAEVERLVELDPSHSKFDWLFQFAEMPDGRLELILEYADEIFDRSTVEMLGADFVQFARDVVQQPHEPLPALKLTSSDSKVMLAPVPPPSLQPVGKATLPDWIRSAALRVPDRPAVIFEDTVLNYAEFDEQVGALAALIAQQQIGEEFVAVLMQRSERIVVAVNAIMRSGHGYVPIDTAFPNERIATILSQSKVSTVITDLPESELAHLADSGVRFLTYEAASAEALGQEERITTSLARPESAAYMIFTSGTTGMPKGVVVEHRQAVALLNACYESVDAGATDVFSCAHSFAFDFSVWEMFGALAVGAALVVLPREVVRASDSLAEALATNAVTVLSQTPSSFYALIENAVAEFNQAPLRHVIFGGEALSLPRIRAWWQSRAEIDRPLLNNMYGITETTVHVTTNPLSDKDICTQQRSLIGDALPSLTVYVLDENLDPCLPGVTGEIYVAGQQVTRGYFGRTDLTASRFVANPFSETGERMYRSGDLGRWVHDSEGRLVLAYEGRNDSQVKVRGFRIETGEVVAALQALDEVNGAAVSTFTDDTGSKQLVAWVTATTSSGPAIRTELANHVPSHLVPALVIVVDEFPRTPNGKLDLKALPAPVFTGESRPPTTDAEKRVHAILAQILGTDQFGVDDSFFDLGGHSLMSTVVVERLHEAGLGVRVKDFFGYPTVTGILEHSAKLTDEQDHGWFTPTLEFGTGSIELHCVHPGMGLAWRYSRLAQVLGNDIRVIAYQARGLIDGQELYRDVPDSGDYIVERIKASTQRPGGPIWLTGWSFGGLAAFDAAVKLEAEGWKVGLILLDAWTVDDLSFSDEEAGRDAIIRSVWEYAQGDPTHAPNTVEELAVGLKNTKLSLDLHQLERLIAVGLNCSKLIIGYEPNHFDGPGLFIIASDSAAAGLDAGTWRPHFAELDIEPVAAGHYALLEPEGIGITASRIRNFLTAHSEFAKPADDEPEVA